MWIFTSTGFVSAVQKPGDADLTVRARDHRSLEPLAAGAGVEITESRLADYPYRVVVTREAFAGWLVSCVDDLDYPNFKSQVARSRGYGFAHALSDVWSDMHAVTDLP